MKKKNGDKIKVGFLVQMPELWDKQSGVYKLMCENDAFEPWLIIVPKYDIQELKLCKYGDEKEYFISQCINGKYKLAPDNAEDFDIQNENFEYLFYQRPYNNYLSKKLRSDYTVKFTKICYIPYATPEIKQTTIYPRNFFRDVYLGFMEDKGGAEENIRRMKRFSPKGIHNFVSMGYPPFERCLQLNSECSYERFLWTPRWSYDKITGGSHFMEYYKQLTDFEWDNSKFVVRPHPMMWDYFIRKGILDEAKKNEILSLWEKNGIPIDKNKSIEQTFDETDVMISDRSSVIPMFFMTGKPVIYCPIECEYGSLFSTILPGLYIANSWEVLEKYITMT